MSKFSKIPYKKVFRPIRIVVHPFLLTNKLNGEITFFFSSENYSVVHLINSGTFIDLLSPFYERKIDFGLFQAYPKRLDRK